MKRRFFSSDCGAFSLLELLIACAVIAVLALTLLQVMGSLRQQSETARCAANLRQIGVYIHLYGSDHNGELLPTLQWMDPIGSGGITWADILNQNQILRFQEWNQIKGSLMHCPSRTTLNPRGYGNSLPSANHDGLHYGMNSFPGVDNRIAYGATRNKLTAIRKPSETVLMTEADWTYLIYPTLSNKRIYPHKGCNLLFADGHVQFHSGSLPVYGPEKLQPDAWMPPFMGTGR